MIYLIAQYTIDRESLYDRKYSNVKVKIIKGSIDEKMKFKTPIPVIYRIIKIIRKKKCENG